MRDLPSWSRRRARIERRGDRGSGESGRRGGCCMTPGVRSKASASAGRPSVIRLIQRICAAVNGSSSAPEASRRPRMNDSIAPAATSSTSDMFVEKRNAGISGCSRRCCAPVARLDDGGEVVVEQHEVGDLAADVGSALTHRDADVRTLQCGGIIDAVSVIATISPCAWSASTS